MKTNYSSVVSLSSCLLKARHKAISRTCRPRSVTIGGAAETGEGPGAVSQLELTG